MLNHKAMRRAGTTVVASALAFIAYSGCQPFPGDETRSGGAEDFALLSILGTEAGGGVGLGNLSSGTVDEDEYYCGYTDADETAGSSAGWTPVRIVSPSTDIGGKYKAFEDLSLIRRHGIAIIEPDGAPAHSEREYITFFSAGHQGPALISTDVLFTGYPASVTGQRKGWSTYWSPWLASSMTQQTCKAGLRNRIIADALINGRLPAGRTYHTGAFDSHFSWADFNSIDTATAWVEYIKSLGNPRRIKGVYLAGSSMGGCLANYIGSQLNKDPEWGKVPVIVQGGDPVCPNGANSNSPSYLTIGPSKIYNPKADNDSILLDKNKYFTYSNNTNGFFRDQFPNKERIKIYNIVGGGKVTGLNKSRSFSVTDEGLSAEDGTLSHADGSFGGSFTSNTWYRQFFMYECHACLGRNWHHWIMETGDATQHGMMRFYRDSYNDLNFWGAWVNFWTGDYNAATETYSGGLKHESPMLQTQKVQLFADKDQADFLLREIVVPIEIAAGTTATYGVDFDFLDENKDPVPVYPTAFAGGAPDAGGFPAGAKNVFLKPNGGGAPTLYVRKPQTASGQNQGYFYIRVLNDSDVESDETIVLRIGEYPVLGRPRVNARKYTLTIRDHDTVPHTQASCEAAGGVWDPGAKVPCMMKATASPNLPATGTGTSGTGGSTSGTCDAGRNPSACSTAGEETSNVGTSTVNTGAQRAGR